MILITHLKLNGQKKQRKKLFVAFAPWVKAWAHKPEVSGSIPLPATKPRTKIPKSFFICPYFYNKSNK